MRMRTGCFAKATEDEDTRQRVPTGALTEGRDGAYICFYETNPIYFDSKTEAIVQGFKVLEIKKVAKIFGFVLENEPNFGGF